MQLSHGAGQHGFLTTKSAESAETDETGNGSDPTDPKPFSSIEASHLAGTYLERGRTLCRATPSVLSALSVVKTPSPCAHEPSEPSGL